MTSNLTILSPTCIFTSIFHEKVQFCQTFWSKKSAQSEEASKGAPSNLADAHCFGTFKVSKCVFGPVFTMLVNFDRKKVLKQEEESDVTSQNLPTEHILETIKYLIVSRSVPATLPPPFWYIW